MFIMLKKVLKNIGIVFLLFLAVALSFILFRNKTDIIHADNKGRITGWAYGNNIGWVSVSSSTPVDYGVEINNTTGDFSGYAWSEMFGWIYFGPDTTIPTYGLIASSSAPSDPKTWAKFATTTGAVTGWAKILLAGADGWIKMSDDSVDVWNGKGVKIDLATGDFSGWAWNNDSANVGWISFNSADCDQDSNNYIDIACFGDNTTTPVISYKVNFSNLIPVTPIMGAIENLPSFCYGAKVNWADKSSNETGFVVEKSRDSSNWSIFCSVNPDITNCFNSGLDPSTTYYFRVKATGAGGDSAWSPSDSGIMYNTSYCAPVVSLGSFDCDKVEIKWAQAGTGVYHYEVWRDGVLATTTVATIKNYIDTDIDPKGGDEYEYKIIAQTEGLTSNSVFVIPCPTKLPKWKEVKPE